ncbi:MAG: adenosine-specific kinase [Conexivisphaerales archaeon]
MELKVVNVDTNGFNVILGQSHFIKTVEDLYEAIITSSLTIKFGIAFCESSGDMLIRTEGNDIECIEKATEIARVVAAGHCFTIALKDSYPINVLDRVKNVQEVVNIYCATANPLQVIVAETEQGRGIMGVIDGSFPKGLESETDKQKRQKFLRDIGYKR